MSRRKVDSRKVLLVCSPQCGQVEDQLLRAGYYVTKVDEGTAAIERAKHQPLNAAVLISTGKEMDLAETVLNLRDVNPDVEIIIVAGAHHSEERAGQTAAIVRALPDTTVVTPGELDRHLASLPWKGRTAT
jgi:DNA-binding NarL/FixJ family response regulator